MNETVVKTRDQGGFRKISDLINATKSKQFFNEFEKNVAAKPEVRTVALAENTKKIFAHTKK